MEIHNLMEELVSATMEDLCTEDQSGEKRYCTSAQCRTDALCYVLNRIPPKYVSSGRGLAHLTDQLQQDQQLMVDIVRLSHEGLYRVSVVQRGYYGETSAGREAGPCFNFPTIKGRILDGSGFMPLSQAWVALQYKGSPIPMFDERWSNPYQISTKTPGTYTFWPAPESTGAEGEDRSFDLELRVQASGYDELVHHFSVKLTSDRGPRTVFDLERDFHLPDLYLFPR